MKNIGVKIMTTKEDMSVEQILNQLDSDFHDYYNGKWDFNGPKPIDNALAALNKLREREAEKVDRFEVIDETGRAYVKGSIYGSPVSIDLSYQDDGKTLKVFVNQRLLGGKE